VPSANTLVRWEDENAFASVVQARPCPTFGRPVHLRGGPHRLRPGTSPHALRIPSCDGHPALRGTAISPASEVLRPLLDIAPLIRAPEGLEPSRTTRCSARATGRSDCPNQVNNVLAFPFIFRGALDVRASTINVEMKLAVTRALAALAKEPAPDSVCRAYGAEQFQFGPGYILPKPFDPHALVWVASAVARAAMQSGVARQSVDLEEYRRLLDGLAAQLQSTLARPARKQE
jgi:hypothetical protein